MKNLYDHSVNRYRGESARLGDGDETCGMFFVPSPIDGRDLVVIASAGSGWDHVSVSRRSRTPNWPEMDYVKRLFFADDETVVQYHVPPSDHVNLHPNCLHLWRPQESALPRPPAWMVGPTPGQTLDESLAEGDAELRARGEL